VTEELKKLGEQKLKIGYDENTCNYKLFEAFKDFEPLHLTNVVESLKAVKNITEMNGMRKVNILNCVSLIEYFSWMEDHLKHHPDSDMTEYTAAVKLDEFRK
jgi:Xaa-Pro aminopeptidase